MKSYIPASLSSLVRRRVGNRMMLTALINTISRLDTLMVRETLPKVATPHLFSMVMRTMPTMSRLAMLAIISLKPTFMFFPASLKPERNGTMRPNTMSRQRQTATTSPTVFGSISMEPLQHGDGGVFLNAVGKLEDKT